MKVMSLGQTKAWIAATRNGNLCGVYTSSAYSFERCKADAENPDHEDHDLARTIWLRYLQERIEG